MKAAGAWRTLPLVMIGFIGVILAVAVSVVLYRIAEKQNRNGEFWAALGAIVSLLCALSIGALWSAPLALAAGLGGMKLLTRLDEA